MLAKSGVLIKAGNSEEAISILDRILAATNSIPARFNRAYAYLAVSNYPAAQLDYQELKDAQANPYFVNLGLAEVALRQHNTNLATQYLLECLSYMPPASLERSAIRARLDALAPSGQKAGPPAPK
jgi:tetratricopeptide (TPR) repeat protein